GGLCLRICARRLGVCRWKNRRWFSRELTRRNAKSNPFAADNAEDAEKKGNRQQATARHCHNCQNCQKCQNWKAKPTAKTKQVLAANQRKKRELEKQGQNL